MQIRTTYEHQQADDRVTIVSMTRQRCSMRAIARVLQRSPSTISREIARNRADGAAYGSHRAQQTCQARRRAAKPVAKLAIDSMDWGIALTLLAWRWLPQQIAVSLRRIWPNQAFHVSHGTIYNALYAQARGELRSRLIARFRRGHRTRRQRSRRRDWRRQIPDMMRIHVHPPEIENRVMPCHGEGDFIKGASDKFSVGMIAERSCRLMLLAKMNDTIAVDTIADSLKNRPRAMHVLKAPLAVFSHMLAIALQRSTRPIEQPVALGT